MPKRSSKECPAVLERFGDGIRTSTRKISARLCSAEKPPVVEFALPDKNGVMTSVVVKVKDIERILAAREKTVA